MRRSGESTSTDDILEQLLRDGWSVTKRQLSNWHRHGLLAQPTRKTLGKGKGSVSLYPPDTFEQAKSVCEFMASPGKHTLDEIGLMLWVAGFPVSTKFIREALMAEVKEFDLVARSLLDEDLLERLDAKRLRSKALKSIRSSFRNGKLEGAMFSDLFAGFGRMVTGSEVPLDQNAQVAVSQIFKPIASPLGNEDPLPEILTSLQAIFTDITQSASLLAALPDEELLRLRNRSAMFSDILRGIFRVFGSVFFQTLEQRSLVRGIGDLLEEVQSSAGGRVMMMLSMFVVLEHFSEEQIDEIFALSSTVQQTVEQLELLQVIGDAVPTKWKRIIEISMQEVATGQNPQEALERITKMRDEHADVIDEAASTHEAGLKLVTYESL